MQRVNWGKPKIEINQEDYFNLLRNFIIINLYVPLSIGTVLSHTCEVFLLHEVSLELSDTFAASEQLENGRQDPIRQTN